MNALYSPNEIENIFSCLRGSAPHITLIQLEKRLLNYFDKKNIHNVLRNMYRLGIIGNVSKGMQRWQHRDNDEIILNGTNLISIHRALNHVLSLNSRIKQDNTLDFKIMIDEVVTGSIVKIFDSCAIVSISIDKKTVKGFIDVKNLFENYKYNMNISDYLSIGQVVTCKVLSFNNDHNSYDLKIINNIKN